VNDKRASLTGLIDALLEQERHPDLKLIEAILRRRDEIVPDLIEIVEAERGWPLIHAALLLCELRATAVLQRALSAPWGHDLADWLVDDALEKFGPAALDTLETIAADRTAECGLPRHDDASLPPSRDL
jgi:hypothetical protein